MKSWPDVMETFKIGVNATQLRKMNGIELSRQLLELDYKVKICFITAGVANIEVLRELSI